LRFNLTGRTVSTAADVQDAATKEAASQPIPFAALLCLARIRAANGIGQWRNVHSKALNLKKRPLFGG
jgi:hypothetical protein